MKELIFYILLFTLGITILIPTLAIALCASAIVLVTDELITYELQRLINERYQRRNREHTTET